MSVENATSVTDVRAPVSNQNVILSKQLWHRLQTVSKKKVNPLCLNRTANLIVSCRLVLQTDTTASQLMTQECTVCLSQADAGRYETAVFLYADCVPTALKGKRHC